MIESYSKINLFLKILKKKNNGLHNLQSSVMLLDLYDLISVKIIKKKQDEIKFIGRFKKKINYKSNSITKSLYILRKNRLISKKKNIKLL